MSNLTTQTQIGGLKSLLESDSIKNKLNDILGKRAPTFATSIIQIAQSNDLLARAEPNSIVAAAMTAATLNLPLNNNLGLAYIIPFKKRNEDGSFKQVAQFQIGYKGFIQLAQRTGQFTRINSTDVRKDEIAFRDRLSGDIDFQWITDDKERLKTPIIGYVAYFRLKNGFEASLYMSMQELTTHGKKFSQTFKKDFGLWKDDFDSMAKKTVLKLLLSKKAPLSIDMQTAVNTDQASFDDVENTEDIDYIDNTEVKIDPEKERILGFIKTIETQDDVDVIRASVPDDMQEVFNEKLKEKGLN